MFVANATLADACRQAAEGFLESVIVIDDRAFQGPQLTSALARPDEGPLVRRRSRILTTPAAARQATAAPRSQEHELNVRELVSVFASKGLTCGVLSPDPTATGDVPMAAVSRADIVVLDWDLHGDNGDGALQIIDALWDKGDALNRLRLVAVYTGDRDLHGIVAKITARLKALGPSPVRSDGSFVRRKEMLRVAVFAKPYAAFGNSERAKRARIVREADLPDRLLAEFATLTCGLLPTVALLALAAVRQNTHRVVSRLSSALDSAYLWHRAMLSNPADAEEHLVDLVAAELHSVIENDGPGRGANLDAIRLWVHDQDLAKLARQFGSDSAIKEADVLAVLEFGIEKDDGAGQWLGAKLGIGGKDGLNKKKIAGFSRTVAEAGRSDAEFANLLSLKTRYTNPAPRLWQGVIVAAGRGIAERYWLCLQPKCDSVRLTGPTSFPMLPLTPVGEGRKFDVVVRTPKGMQRLDLSRKPADLKMISFAPPTGEDSIVGQGAGADKYRFRAATGRHTWYRFVAELKSDTSQAFASELANSISRVGLNESEWLRRWREKGGSGRNESEQGKSHKEARRRSSGPQSEGEGNRPATGVDEPPANRRPRGDG
jgi:Response receiver domain